MWSAFFAFKIAGYMKNFVQISTILGLLYIERSTNSLYLSTFESTEKADSILDMVGLWKFYDYCFKHDACKSYSTILTNNKYRIFFFTDPEVDIQVSSHTVMFLGTPCTCGL